MIKNKASVKMLEGYIASKFADKYFEKDVFHVIKQHAFVVAILALLPDCGIIYVIGLWHMYAKVAEKCDVSFMDNYKSLITTGMIVNLIVYIVADTAFTLFPYATPFISYLMFYLSGKMYVESVKLLPLPKNAELQAKNLIERNKTAEQTLEIASIAHLYSPKLTEFRDCCPSCRKEIDSGSVFCPFCGAKIEDKPALPANSNSTKVKPTINDKFKELENLSARHILNDKFKN